MKKLILLIILSFTLTGCYNYQDLENLAVVASIGIDYKDNKYHITYEVLNNQKEQNKVKLESYTVSSDANTITDAFTNASRKIKKNPYFDHAEILIISKTIAEEKIEELRDFFLRNNQFRTYLYLVIAEDPKDILSTETEEKQIKSQQIKSLMEVNNYAMDTIKPTTFEDFINNIENYKIDNIVPIINIKNKELDISSLALFNKYKLKEEIDTIKGSLINLFYNNDAKYYLVKYYDDGIIELSLKMISNNIKIENNKINIEVTTNGVIVNNSANINIEDTTNYKKIRNELEPKLNEDIKNLVMELQSFNTDVLSFKYKYYLDTRKNLNNTWNDFEIEVKSTIKISMKGMIYEAN